MTREHAGQNDIRNALVDVGYFYRANVGQAWASNDIARLPDGSLLLRDPRPFSTGLPAGFSDLFGFVPVVITADMIGQMFPMFIGIECKSSKGKAREAQERFVNVILTNGGRAGFARTVQEAVDIALGKRGHAGR